MRYPLGVEICAALLLVCLTGCGGGGGSQHVVGGTTGVLSATQRMTVLTLLEQTLEALPHTSFASDNQAILTFMKSRPEFAAEGISDFGTVWGLFTDGSIHIVFNNLSPSPSPASRTAIPAVVPGRGVNLPGTGSGPNVVVLNALGSAFTYYQHYNEASLFGSDYSVTTPVPSVANLQTMSGVSVLYFTTHIGPFQDKYSHTWPGIWTSTPVTLSTVSTYNSELHDGTASSPPTLVTGSAASDWVQNPTTGAWYISYPNQFAITSNFINKYHWSFTPNSLVFMNGCVGQNPFATALKTAITGAGATVYAGWDYLVDSHKAFDAGALFLDTLLGTNMVTSVGNTADGVISIPHSPPWRPFPMTPTIQELTQVGLSGYTVTYPPFPSATTTLTITDSGGTSGSTSFGILEPSIEYLWMDEPNDALHIYGSFGSAAGSVTINGQPLGNLTWSPTEITSSSMPRTGAASYGQVLVQVNGHTSNPRWLTEWNGITVTDTVYGQGSENYTMTWTASFRADILTSRPSPVSATLYVAAANSPFYVLPNGTAAYTVGGSYVDPNVHTTTTWSANSSQKPTYTFQVGAAGVQSGQFAFMFTPNGSDTAASTLSLDSTLYVLNGLKVTIVNQDGSSGGGGLLNIGDPNLSTQPTLISLNSGYNFSAGQTSYGTSGTPGYTTVSWTPGTVLGAPSANAARAANVVSLNR